jgi:hypothetical protein
VCGTVASTHYAPRSRGQPTFLNLGHAYPNEDFTAVIWGENRAQFGTPEEPPPIAPSFFPVHKRPSPQTRNVWTVSRSSLKITRHDDRKPPGDFSFEVWNPITTRYEPMTSLADGLNRVTDLAEEVRQMWVRHGPALSSWKDAPDPAEDDETEWAEFRVSAQAKLVYETRNFDQREWRQARNRIAAIQTICNEVGYVPP